MTIYFVLSKYACTKVKLLLGQFRLRVASIEDGSVRVLVIM